MEISYDRVALTLTRKCHQLATVFAFALGIFVLFAWTIESDRLGTPTLKNGAVSVPTALTFVLASLSFGFWRNPQGKGRRLAARTCGAAVALVGLLSIGKHLLDWSTYPARHVSDDHPFAFLSAPEHQIAFNSALSLILLGIAICLVDVHTRRGKRSAEWFALGSAFVPFAALAAHIYGVQGFITPFPTPFSPASISLHTTIGLLALSIAALTVRPEHGWMARFVSDRPEGVVARKLLPTGILALLMLGWLTEGGEQAGFYSHDDGAAILVALSGLTLALLIRHSMNALATLEASREEAEASLRKSEEHLRIALDAARVGTWELEFGTNKLRWSDAINEMFGLPKGKYDDRGEKFLEIIHPEDQGLVISRAQRAAQSVDETYSVEYRITRPEGAIRWIASRGEVFRDASGNPIRMAGTSIDITERRLLERELIEASNREQRRLGQDLHDDLGQWLTAIHLETRALAMRLRTKSESDAAHAERIVSCIREALDRTRLLARGMTPAVIESGGLTAALQELAISTERMFRTQCHFTYSETLSVQNAEAALQLYRIAQEAISNAIRHGNATEIALTLEPQESRRARLVIRDNGHGIPQPLPRGSGLGLNIMHYRAGLLGANVDICPAPGGGTAVTCSFSSEL